MAEALFAHLFEAYTAGRDVDVEEEVRVGEWTNSVLGLAERLGGMARLGAIDGLDEVDADILVTLVTILDNGHVQFWSADRAEHGAIGELLAARARPAISGLI
jgi:hypothetical protein